MIIKANDPSLSSWIPVAPGSDFPIQNLPLGIFKPQHLKPRAGMAIGEYVIDLAALHVHDFLKGVGIPFDALESEALNGLIGLGKETVRKLRQRVSEILQADNASLRDHPILKDHILYLRENVQLLLPIRIGDYTDFYSSIEHATNVGIMFRGVENALMPNWKHIPVGYHGRSSSIVVSGTDCKRPSGQVNPNDGQPEYSLSRQLDFELEMAFVVGKENKMGTPVSTAEAEDHIIGLMLFNDWSARDIQKWEYVPLGPFLGKNFCSTLSPWLVLLDALEPFRSNGPEQDPKVLPYLQYEGKKNYNIDLEVWIKPENAEATRVSQSNFKYMYWNMCQQLAHHTVNGCNMRVGDLCASGTISGPSEGSFGSMLEIAWRGTKPVNMKDGTERKFILDGDEVIMKGFCEANGVRIGFGDVSGKVVNI